MADSESRDSEVDVARKGFELPSKLSLTVLAIAAAILIAVPFLVTVLWGQLSGSRAQPLGASGGPDADPTKNHPRPVVGQDPDHAAPSDSWTVVVGPGCPSRTTGNYDDVGSFSDGIRGWYRVPGGVTSAGCDGTFDAVPMSGDKNWADPTTYAQWSFDFSQQFREGRCRLAVYIPDDDDIRNVGGSPANYEVFRSPTLADNAFLREFTVDQIAYRGQWFDAGLFDLVDGRLSVRMNNAGQDWEGERRTEAHLAAAQMRASCQPG